MLFVRLPWATNVVAFYLFLSCLWAPISKTKSRENYQKLTCTFSTAGRSNRLVKIFSKQGEKFRFMTDRQKFQENVPYAECIV